MKDMLSKKAVMLEPSGIRKFFDIVSEMPEAISLGVGEPDFDTPWRIREEGIYSLEKGRTFYTSNAGLKELREEICRYLKRKYHMRYKTEEILVSVGGSEGIDVALRAIINPGDEVIVPQPSFVCYVPCVVMADGVPVTVELKAEDKFKLTREQLEAVVTDKTKAIIMSFPNNPTGAIMTKKDLEPIAEFAKEHDLLVISDEIYSELTYGHKHVSIGALPDMKERTIVINGFSKAFAMTGWRLGYAVKIDDLKYKYADTLQVAKNKLIGFFGRKKEFNIYTTSSRAARGISMVLSALPLGLFMLVSSVYSYTGIPRMIVEIVLWILVLGGMLLFTTAVDGWYARSRESRKLWVFWALAASFLSAAAYTGSYVVRVRNDEIFNYIWVLAAVLVMTAGMILMTGFMKKRTHQCIEWMGHLAGLRDFIETAELDRMKALAEDQPQLFYHIMPYAYVFGLSDVFAEKLKDLGLAAPDWYVTDRQFTFFDYYIFNRCLMGNMAQAASTLSVPEPPKPSSGGGGGFGGGSFGGGGFSGGGFGGGGGGSW